MATPSETGVQGKRVMAGHLEEVDIFSVAQFLMLQQKTGTLELKCDGKSGKVFFEGGQIIDAQDSEAGSPEDVAFRLFQWKGGAFDFFSTGTAVARKIEKDAQTLLFELAVKMDEQSAQAAEETPAEAPAEEPAATAVAEQETQTPAPGAPQPLKAKAVRPAGKAVARLVRRSGAAAAAVGAPGISETQFMQAVQDRLTVFVDELPETSGREWRQEMAAGGTTEAPSRKVGILLSMISTAVLVVLIVVLLRRPTDGPPQGNDINTPPPVEPELPPSYTFVTAPFTPEREAEDAVRKIPFKCTVNKIDVIGDSLNQGVVMLRKEAFWGTDELQNAAEHDAAHVINNIFESPSCKNIQKIDLRVQAHVGIGADLEKWTDVLIVDADRTFHKTNIKLKTDDECPRYLKLFNPTTRYE